jgi:pSer/pThr/pTyr-binding forkhead associated (FHA) protein
MYIIDDCGVRVNSYVALDAQLHISEAGRPDRIVVARDIMTIGRDGDNDIVLESISVSRCHAVLVRKAAGLLLVDLESTNGTLVNGLPALPDEPIRLVDGDELQFGEVVVRCVVAKNVG